MWWNSPSSLECSYVWLTLIFIVNGFCIFYLGVLFLLLFFTLWLECGRSRLHRMCPCLPRPRFRICCCRFGHHFCCHYCYYYYCYWLIFCYGMSCLHRGLVLHPVTFLNIWCIMRYWSASQRICSSSMLQRDPRSCQHLLPSRYSPYPYPYTRNCHTQTDVS